jgi:hypothetical protein
MLMDGSEWELLGGLGRRETVEPVLEDRVDVAVRADTDSEGAGAGGSRRAAPSRRLRRSKLRQER